MFKRNLAAIILVTVSTFTFAQYSSIGILISPLKKQEAQAGLYYNHALGDSFWSLRSSVTFGMDRSKEIRYDSLTQHYGSFSYNFAVGLQKDIDIKGAEWFSTYLAADLYWNSEQLRRAQDTYYGYYYSFGLMPIIGVKLKAWSNFQVFVEGRANLNINRQSYTGPGDNYDRKYTFNSMDHMALGLVYVL